MQMFEGPGIIVTTQDGWEDISDAETDLPPFLTLVKAEGDGALQFSAGPLHGEHIVSSQSLAAWIADYGNTHQWGLGQDVVTEEVPLLLASATFGTDNEPMRVWLVSDGTNSVLIHYTIEADRFNVEAVQECEVIIRNLRFVDEKDTVHDVWI